MTMDSGYGLSQQQVKLIEDNFLKLFKEAQLFDEEVGYDKIE